jgi:hypothetical protein
MFCGKHMKSGAIRKALAAFVFELIRINKKLSMIITVKWSLNRLR